MDEFRAGAFGVGFGEGGDGRMVDGFKRVAAAVLQGAGAVDDGVDVDEQRRPSGGGGEVGEVSDDGV